MQIVWKLINSLEDPGDPAQRKLFKLFHAKIESLNKYRICTYTYYHDKKSLLFSRGLLIVCAPPGGENLIKSGEEAG